MEDNNYIVKFLVIRFSSIGDIVLTTPIVRCLKEQVENAEVHFITKAQYVEILADNPFIDKILTLKSFSETIDKIKEENYDYLIDLHNNIRSLRFKNKLKIVDFSFPKLNWQKWLMVHFKINKLPDIHIVDRYFETVKLFDVTNDSKGLDFFINPNNEINIQALNSEDSIEIFKALNYIALAIGGRHNTKKMPVEMLVKICENLDIAIILLGGEEDFDNGKFIKNSLSLENQHLIINLCGKLNLQQSASVLKQAKLVISNDSGLMHIAAAFKKNIISFWGNTIPRFGMTPYLAGEKSEIFEVENLKCRPCSKIGYEKCPKKHFNCMKMLNIEKIIEKINKLYYE